MTHHQRRAFRPAVNDELEDRVVLSGAGGRLPSVLVEGLTPGLRSLGKSRHPSPAAQANKAFDSFVQDFTQARATYLSGGGKDDNLTAAFKSYTRYRVNLLGQQIISTGLQSSAKPSKHQKGNELSLPAIVSKRITGSNGANTKFLPGTLGQALTDATPVLGQSHATIALASLAQDQAIEAARVNVLNGFSVIKNGNSGGRSN